MTSLTGASYSVLSDGTRWTSQTCLGRRAVSPSSRLALGRSWLGRSFLERVNDACLEGEGNSMGSPLHEAASVHVTPFNTYLHSSRTRQERSPIPEPHWYNHESLSSSSIMKCSHRKFRPRQRSNFSALPLQRIHAQHPDARCQDNPAIKRRE